jgi:hypothetical protein
MDTPQTAQVFKAGQKIGTLKVPAREMVKTQKLAP